MVILAVAIPAAVKAEVGDKFEYQGISYTVTSETDKTVSTTPDYGNMVEGDIVLPATVMNGDKTYTLTAIGDHGFYNNYALTSIAVPNTVTEIGESAFASSALTSITLSEGLTEIKQRTFESCFSLTEIAIPNSVTTLGGAAFSYCNNLASITLSNNLEYIGGSAFYKCFSLSAISIPESVKTIGEYAFSECTSLSRSEFASVEALCNIDFVGSYDSNPMYHSKQLIINGEEMTNVVIPETVTAIRNGTFFRAANVVSFTIPATVTSIGDYSFYGCESLRSLIMPNSVTSIGGWCFYGCTNLRTLSLSNNLETIGWHAFTDCKKIEAVSIPASVTSIGNDAFEGCGGIKKAEFASLESLCSIDFSTNASNPLYYGHDLYINGEVVKHVVIPSTITAIGDYAFHTSTITSVSFPNTLTSIGGSAFNDCQKLTAIDIPASVTTIEPRAFYYCTHVKSVKIPATVTDMGAEAFYLHNEYFVNDTEIEYLTQNPLDFGNDIFDNYLYSHATLYALSGYAEKYYSKAPWRNFDIIVEKEDTGIGEVTNDDERPADVYDLQGVLVRRAATAAEVEALPAGIYIVGGKKVLVK